MATIELTTSVVVAGASWLTTALVTTWALSRKSRTWDNAEQHEETLYGNSRENKPGIVQRVGTLEEAFTELSHKMKLLITSLDAHGSGEHQVSEGIRRKMREHAAVVYQEIAEQRRQIAAEQTGRFPAVRQPDSFVVIEDERTSAPPPLPPPPLPPPRKR